ncbi:MAG: hypothetical protein ABIM89_11720 [Mycobacteriales bacterium]
MTTSIRAVRTRTRARTLGLAGVLGLVLGSGALVADAHAAPSTKFFTARVTPAAVGAGISQQAFTVTLTNCGSATPGCAKPSQQTLGSANITLDAAFSNVSASVATAGWYVVAPVTGGTIELRSSGVALEPGQSIDVAVRADTPAGSGNFTWTTVVKQSNDFAGNGNEFTLAGTQPQVATGIAHHLVFTTGPTTVQVSAAGGPTSYICPAPSVQVVAADGSPVTTGTANVTVLADANFGNPGLAGTTIVATTAGSATFGSPSCTSGLSARNLGTGYRLRATATWSFGTLAATLSTNAPSSPFDVIQVRTVCQPNQTCGASAKGSHTAATVVVSAAPTTDVLEFAIGVDQIPANTTCLPADQPTGLEVVRVLVDHRDKTVTMTFDKYLVQQIPDNGTPRFPICFAAPWDGWKTASGGDPVFNSATQEFEGLLPGCGAAGLAAGNPCVTSRRKSAASEIATVSIPFLSGRADPKLW